MHEKLHINFIYNIKLREKKFHCIEYIEYNQSIL